MTSDRFNGSDGPPRLNNPLPGSGAMAPEDDSAPTWVREIHAAPTHPPFSSFLAEEMALQIPEPTVPLSTPNGKFTLPAFANGSRPSFQPSSDEEDDPPTVPLPSVQGGLRTYAAKREPPVQEARRESAPEIKLAIGSLPEQTLARRSAPVATSPPPPQAPSEVAPATAPLAPATPSNEPKLSSLAMLEQLAYGGSGNNGGTEADTRVPAPASTLPVPVGVAPVLSSLPAPSPASPGAEGVRHVQQALETFAEQVGAACIATAVVRSDGMLLAEYKLRRGQDQDLASPAYHMAHVMQDSLRALLMGGWGDLEDTFITGSTHSVMLRRLGRAEKGLFHVAVLERSGNPGLCRVRMRNNEAALLQMISVELPTATS